MRSIYSILDEIHSIVDMELTGELSSLLAVLSTFNDHVKPFRNLQTLIDNERYLSELKRRIVSFLNENHLWNHDTTAPSTADDHQMSLRKITLFLIYNTDTEGNHIIESGTNTAHLVGHIPRISKCVLFFLIRELSLFSFFCEFIQYSTSEMVVHFLDSELLNGLKPLDKFHRLEILPQLISGTYHHCWLAAFSSDNKENANREDHFERIRDFLATLLLTHFDATRDKYPDLSKQLDYDTFVGKMLRHHLIGIIQCLETFRSKKIGPPLNNDLLPVFQIDELNRCPGEYRPNAFTKTFLADLNNLLLNRLQIVVMTVSGITFMNWFEVDLSKTVTLQRAVGELAHQLSELLNGSDELVHEIQTIIKGIAVKPRNAEEMAGEAIIPDIIAHIEDQHSRDRDVWMREFLKRGDLVLDNEECLAVIAENLHLLAVQDLKRLTDFLKENVGSELLSFVPQIVDIILNTLSSTRNATEVEDFLEKEEPFQVFLEYDLDADKYFHSLTEFLNKLVDCPGETEPSYTPFVKALVIDPKRAIVEVQKCSISDPKQVTVGIKLLGTLKGFVARYMDEIVAELLTDTSGDEKGLELYVLELFSGDYVDKEEFLKCSLFPEILRRSQEKDQEHSMVTLSLLDILKGVLSSDAFDLSLDLRAPFIVGLGQVADQHRWDLMSYTDTEEKIVALSTELIGIIGAGEQELQGKHKAFIRLKSQALKEMNRFYVERIFTEEPELDFVRYLHAAPFRSDKSRRDFLCKTFVRATLGEKERLSDCDQLKPHFVDMMLNITKAVAGHEPLLVGFRSCFSGFLKIMKERLLSQVALDNLLGFVDVVGLLPLDIYADQMFVVNSVILSILDRTEGEARQEILQKVKEFPESSGKSHLLERIVADEEEK